MLYFSLFLFATLLIFSILLIILLRISNDYAGHCNFLVFMLVYIIGISIILILKSIILSISDNKIIISLLILLSIISYLYFLVKLFNKGGEIFPSIIYQISVGSERYEIYHSVKSYLSDCYCLKIVSFIFFSDSINLCFKYKRNTSRQNTTGRKRHECLDIRF